MTQDELKEQVARAAVAYVVPGAVLGVGSGSTAERFIEALRPLAATIPAAVASSERTAARLRGIGVEVRDLNDVTAIPVYVDGADEIDALDGDGQGRRRRADAREDRRRGGAALRVHRRRLEAGRAPRAISAAGRGDPDGARVRRARTGQPGRRAEAARRLHHRQRQRHPRRVRTLDRRPGGTGRRDQRHRRRGHQRPVRPPRGRRAAARHRRRRADDHARAETSPQCRCHIRGSQFTIRSPECP